MKIRGNTVGTTMSPEKIAEKIGGTGGGILVVALDYGYADNDAGYPIASHNLAQIEEHFHKGGAVVGTRSSGMEVPLCSIQTHPLYGRIASFVFHDDMALSDIHYFVDELGRSINEERVLTNNLDFEYIVSEIGDISSALDELHTYAQGLIEGGGSV